jgi:hypothetical protein
MTDGFALPRESRKGPESVLWRMTRDGRAIECRTRIVPLREGVPEVRFLMTRTDGTLDLLWRAVMIDRRDVNDFAQTKMREFESRGWQLEPLTATDLA